MLWGFSLAAVAQLFNCNILPHPHPLCLSLLLLLLFSYLHPYIPPKRPKHHIRCLCARGVASLCLPLPQRGTLSSCPSEELHQHRTRPASTSRVCHRKLEGADCDRWCARHETNQVNACDSGDIISAGFLHCCKEIHMCLCVAVEVASVSSR
eukprot:TRINITY_DN3532_c0_g2_i1.p2 TRINITY_DN3532_c0_g2~~TRINITY_DN3532_c0_g2_i1.p2  ORF type:complete len:152 (+),score=1.07 TRINITY_DN3532_c0_g2_i1:181-636(+)